MRPLLATAARAQGPLIDRRIDPGRLAIARPSQRTDLGARGTVVEPRGGRRMAPPRRAPVGGMEPGPGQRSAPDRPNRWAVGNASARRPPPDNDLPCGAGRSAWTAGGDSCCADVVWPWEAIMACALAPDEECPRLPIQIIQGPGRHCTSPSAEPGPPEHNRGIAWPWWGRPVTALPEVLDVRGCHTLGEGRHAPVWNGRHRCGQGGGDGPVLA